MHIDLEEDKLNLEKKLNKFEKFYDYIIIGSGPAASVILNNLLIAVPGSTAPPRR